MVPSHSSIIRKELIPKPEQNLQQYGADVNTLALTNVLLFDVYMYLVVRMKMVTCL